MFITYTQTKVLKIKVKFSLLLIGLCPNLSEPLKRCASTTLKLKPFPSHLEPQVELGVFSGWKRNIIMLASSG